MKHGMMRNWVAAALVGLLPLAAAAEGEGGTAPELQLSAEIAERGLAATAARLAALPQPSDAERFALAGLTFLGSVERALHLRWQVGLSPGLRMLPVLRLPVPANPAPQPLRPELPRALAQGIVEGMQAAGEGLAAIPEDSEFALVIRPADLWFDIDGNGRRDPREGLLEVAGSLLMGGRTPPEVAALEIRFDVADSRWLAAYSSLLRGSALAVLAYDPTAALATVLEARAGLAELNAQGEMANALEMMVGGWADSLAVLLGALEGQPDAELAAQALAAFEQVVVQNRAFWRLSALESDDDREWIPNDRQRSALGLPMPPGTGESWLAVLDDLEALLKGELLLPYWRLTDASGLNLRRMFTEPRPVTLTGWVQGSAALAYAERGKRINSESLRRFDNLLAGRGLLFAIWFN